MVGHLLVQEIVVLGQSHCYYWDLCHDEGVEARSLNQELYNNLHRDLHTLNQRLRHWKSLLISLSQRPLPQPKQNNTWIATCLTFRLLRVFRWMRSHPSIPIRCFDGNPFLFLSFKSQLHKAMRTLGATRSPTVALLVAPTLTIAVSVGLGDFR